MQRWQQRSVYWRYVGLGTAYMVGGVALMSVWASTGRGGVLVLILPLLGVVAALRMSLRCPCCGHRIMLDRSQRFVQSPPKRCQRCKWPTSRAYLGARQG